jgi:hypothetical protein
MLMEALYVIAALAGIWGAFLKTLEHFHLTLPGFGKLLARQPWGKIFWRIYIGIAGIISVILLTAMVSIIYSHPFTTDVWLSTIILADLVLLGIWGIWVPVLITLQNKRLSNSINTIGTLLFTLLFVSYWVYEWPKWQTPVLLTSLIALMLAIFFVFTLMEKRKNKVKAQLAIKPEQEAPKQL